MVLYVINSSILSSLGLGERERERINHLIEGANMLEYGGCTDQNMNNINVDQITTVWSRELFRVWVPVFFRKNKIQTKLGKYCFNGRAAVIAFMLLLPHLGYKVPELALACAGFILSKVGDPCPGCGAIKVMHSLQ